MLCDTDKVMVTVLELKRFRKNLLVWFRQFRRELPWRRTNDPYRIWISEIMLQQTRVVAVVPYYERFLEHFPAVESLADAPQDEVLRLWSGLGYYSRARNLHRAAQQIASKHGGVFPRELESALTLPGIGAYTAAAILSIAYRQKHAALDGNVARVIARLGAIRSELRGNGTWLELQKTADHLLDAESPGDWNQAMMELGATLCTPHSPQCLICPVSEFCEARRKGLTGVIPAKRVKRNTVQITLASLVLLTKRGETLLLPPPKETGKPYAADDVATLVSRTWHFPTVSVEAASPESTLRKFAETTLFSGKALNVELVPLKRVRHAVTYRSVTVLPFAARLQKLPKIAGAQALPLTELSTLHISNLTRKVARSVPWSV
jgi:A/G-specific adenine glycosylase